MKKITAKQSVSIRKLPPGHLAPDSLLRYLSDVAHALMLTV